MRVLMWSALIAVLVPLQSVLLPSVKIGGAMADLGLVVTCLTGVLGGELHGLLMGLVMGWVMSLFSVIDPVVAMGIKGVAGYVAGFAGRYLVALSPMIVAIGMGVLSCGAGLATALVLSLHDVQDGWWVLRVVVLPQAVLDALVGGVLYWGLASRYGIERWRGEYRIS
ncbi:MAG: hypothetical protein NNA18_01475 [Nitrospira sp.]|nr:hypothetical protein [Nitrospira sp.]